MSSALDGRSSHDCHSDPDDGGIVDSNVPHWVARLSSSRLPIDVFIAPDADEASSHSATDLISTFSSTPPSPTSESVTSFDFERGSASDQLSSLSPEPSLYSLTDSIKEQSIRWEHGCAVNAHSDVYKIAAGEEEARRQDKEHRIYKDMFGNYDQPFREVLAENNDPLNPKTCLDIGCGSGAWILEVASAFPHVYCTAVDLVPLPARTQIPSNLRFEIDDVTLGLEHFAGNFDVVHVRFICSGIKDYYRLIDNVALALRPCGLADFTETDWRVYDIEKRPILPATAEIWGTIEPPEGWNRTGMARSGTSPVRRAPKVTATSEPTPFIARFLVLARQAALKRGAHIDAAALLHRWISEHHAYEDVAYREFWLPVGDWLCNGDVQRHPDVSAMTADELERLRRAGKEIGEDLIEFMRSACPLLLSTGIPEELINAITKNASQEIREARIPLFLRTLNVYARKKERRQELPALSAL